jgi:hypothetical protein
MDLRRRLISLKMRALPLGVRPPYTKPVHTVENKKKLFVPVRRSSGQLDMVQRVLQNGTGRYHVGQKVTPARAALNGRVRARTGST